ncbi:hypothetical protein HBI33_186920 [Parastagonospora nodorum]|nr:hypothetical protein HBI33_186920 [Parastagonospora nodorum]
MENQRADYSMNTMPCDSFSDAVLSAENIRMEYDDNFTLDELDHSGFDDNHINENVSTPWTWSTTTPCSYNSEASSKTSGSSKRTPAHESAMTGSESSSSIVARSATALFPLSSSMDQSLEAQLLGGYTLTEGPIDSGPLDMQLLDTNMTWATHSGSFMDTTCDPLALTSPVNEPELGDSSCHCLLHSITFLECLASDSVSRENRMDTLLAEFREAMEKLYVFLAYKCCATSLEQNMLLAKVIRQISLICAKIANSFKALYLHHKKDKKNNTNSSFQQESGLDSSPAAFCSVNILVSSYRVNSREMLFLLDSLVTLHVSEFQEHIDKLKERSRNHLHQDLARALKEAEAYLEQAKETMRICMALG